MLVYVRHAWAWIAAGIALATTLLAAYVAFRTRQAESAPSRWELLLVVAGIVVTITVCTVWLSQRHSRALLQHLSRVVASLRENPSLANLRTVSPELDPLYAELEKLGHSYRQALAQLVGRNEQELRRQALTDSGLQAVPGRPDAEQGRSLFHRGSTH